MYTINKIRINDVYLRWNATCDNKTFDHRTILRCPMVVVSMCRRMRMTETESLHSKVVIFTQKIDLFSFPFNIDVSFDCINIVFIFECKYCIYIYIFYDLFL